MISSKGRDQVEGRCPFTMQVSSDGWYMMLGEIVGDTEIERIGCAVLAWGYEKIQSWYKVS